MTSPGSTYGTCPSPRWTTISPISDREILRRTAISAADGSPSISLIATTALPGIGADGHRTGVAARRERQRELGRPLAGDRDLGQRAFEPARLTDERHDLTDPEPERHQRNPSSRPRA